MIRERAESGVRVLILLAIGTMAGAAAFTHVHDLTVAHGQPDWIGWANAVAVELMAIYLGLEIRARRRAGRPVGLVGVLLIAFALLSLAAQVAEAEPSVWGWIVAAVPSLAFLALVKVVLSSAPATAAGTRARSAAGRLVRRAAAGRTRAAGSGDAAGISRGAASGRCRPVQPAPGRRDHPMTAPPCPASNPPRPRLLLGRGRGRPAWRCPARSTSSRTSPSSTASASARSPCAAPTSTPA